MFDVIFILSMDARNGRLRSHLVKNVQGHFHEILEFPNIPTFARLGLFDFLGDSFLSFFAMNFGFL
jgi:hypothetical protein